MRSSCSWRSSPSSRPRKDFSRRRQARRRAFWAKQDVRRRRRDHHGLLHIQTVDPEPVLAGGAGHPGLLPVAADRLAGGPLPAAGRDRGDAPAVRHAARLRPAAVRAVRDVPDRAAALRPRPVHPVLAAGDRRGAAGVSDHADARGGHPADHPDGRDRHRLAGGGAAGRALRPRRQHPLADRREHAQLLGGDRRA